MEETNQTETPKAEATPEVKMIPQAEVDRIVQERLARDRAKYSDYDQLREKVSSFEKQQEQMSQLDLEKKQEYDKLKDGWTQKEQDYQAKLNDAMRQVQSERVSNTLQNEALKQNAYPDAVKLIKDLTTYHDDGTVTIKGKDANGMDADLPVELGVQQFLKERPYLVKGSGQGGAGTTPAGSAGGDGQYSTDPMALSRDFANAKAVGNHKLANELKEKMRQNVQKRASAY